MAGEDSIEGLKAAREADRKTFEEARAEDRKCFEKALAEALAEAQKVSEKARAEDRKLMEDKMKEMMEWLFKMFTQLVQTQNPAARMEMPVLSTVSMDILYRQMHNPP